MTAVNIPDECYAYEIVRYAHEESLNGEIVTLAGYDYDTGYFIVETTREIDNMPPGMELLCSEDELRPLSALSEAALVSVQEAFAPLQEP